MTCDEATAIGDFLDGIDNLQHDRPDTARIWFELRARCPHRFILRSRTQIDFCTACGERWFPSPDSTDSPDREGGP